MLQLGADSALRLTTARYFTPSGRSVQEGGIRPDIAVPQISDPDYKSRPVFREADLRKHLVNEVKADNVILEEDTKPDPRFAATPDELKKKRRDRFPALLCAADDRRGCGDACRATSGEAVAKKQ